ncbi:MAG: DUF2935 domain-containing protein [Candidatus Enterenecus sp.]
MDNAQDYVVNSLELHLFFARIMKEHAFFLKVGFLPPNADLAGEGERFLRRFEGLLSRAIALSGQVVRRCVLESGELFTEFTGRAECQSQRLTGTFLDRSLTAREMRLAGRDCGAPMRVSPALVGQVRQLNREGLALVDGLIEFKERLLCRVDSCRLFTANYPLLIEHILREARLYRAYLLELEGSSGRSCQELRNSELFWNRIMMEHALFIRGLLDPTEEELICTSDQFAQDYKRLLDAAAAANDSIMPDGGALELTQKFRDFKRSGVQGIEGCQIRFLILPLLADHVLREANHYIRLLEE